MIWAFLLAGIVFLVATNLHIVPDREVWVMERLGKRRFASGGLDFQLPLGLEKKVCIIPVQPSLTNVFGQRINIPDGTIQEFYASIEYKVANSQRLYDCVRTNDQSQTLELEQYIQTWFLAAARDVLKRLPIESICENEEDGSLALELRLKIEADFEAKGLTLVGLEPIRVTSILLDEVAENARRLRYVELKKVAAKSIYAKGESQAIRTLMVELDIPQMQAQRLYLQLQTLATLEGTDMSGVIISDMLSAKLLEIGKRG
ncbi:SPFH domain-containing protein [Picosynechococcus sp. NKBG042902]|uniref:SPFH domain-containing protein n=1 Tax=Picosynechococcus sp. NKBG042902 TaxID=490193 RepID=UPI0004AB8926|nr:SPFH domain-containing protein [Picosynechococcus sp. NKBG042902]